MRKRKPNYTFMCFLCQVLATNSKCNIWIGTLMFQSRDFYVQNIKFKQIASIRNLIEIFAAIRKNINAPRFLHNLELLMNVK